MKALRDSISAELQLSKRLPPAYEEALQNLIPLIYVAWKYAIQRALRVMMSSRKFIEFFHMVPASCERPADFTLRRSPATPSILNMLVDLYEN